EHRVRPSTARGRNARPRDDTQVRPDAANVVELELHAVGERLERPEREQPARAVAEKLRREIEHELVDQPAVEQRAVELGPGLDPDVVDAERPEPPEDLDEVAPLVAADALDTNASRLRLRGSES